jgi:hypothetical protein
MVETDCFSLQFCYLGRKDRLQSVSFGDLEKSKEIKQAAVVIIIFKGQKLSIVEVKASSSI